jgi:hypothetical protein
VKKRAAAPLVLLAILSIGGCKRNIRNTDAVEQAIIDHLGKRGDLNLSTMNVRVTKVEYGQNHDAVATVSFAPKGDTGGGMAMRYHLVEEGGRWVVKGKQDSGGTGGHGGGMANPHGGVEMPSMPPSGAAPPGGADLPPGHPPVQKKK